MKKMYVILVLFLVPLFCLQGCGNARYSEEDIVGLSSDEIVDKYGDFDRKQGNPDSSGLYRDCLCGYLVTEARKGFLGTTPPEYFMIHFDENGIADWCIYEQVV